MTQSHIELEQPFLPRYQVDRFIGEGAAARIYRVVDQRDGAVRAIKALKPESNDEPSIVERFENEFLILRRLHHPSLPEMYDYGFTDDGIRYIVMEFVEGQQLDAYYKEHREDLWLLLYELCEVLSFVHDRDLLHLDLKPANILVKRTSAYGDEKPMVVLMDFGLSYRRDVGGERSLVGTPEYMAPEIIRGDDRLTRAADYYSLGIILYELLTGETPFRGDMNEIFAAHLKQEVRFRQEKTENAELYPHVLGLLGKTVNQRLEDFEGFRHAVSGRLTGGFDELQRAYGISVVSSIGMIGKHDIWESNLNWIRRIDGRVNELIQSSSKQSDPLMPADPESAVPNRLHVVTGPAGCGKTYLLEDIADQLQVRGVSVWRITTDIDLPMGSNGASVGSESPMVEETSDEVNPRAGVYEQHLVAWDRLETDARRRGVVLFVDNYEDLNSRQSGYFEYFLNRIAISSREFSDIGIYVFVTCRNITSFETKLMELFEGTHHTFRFSPLSENDFDSVLTQLRCTPVTDDDRRRLLEFVSPLDDSPGLVVTAMEDASLKGDLLFSNGRWRFRASRRPKKAARKSVIQDYYRDVFFELSDNRRELMEWACCHHGPVPLKILLELSPLNEPTINNCLEILRSYRLLDQLYYGGARSLATPGTNIKNAIYKLISTDRKNRIHNRYSQYYEQCLVDEPGSGPDTDITTSVQLIRQYHGAQTYRRLLLTQIRLSRALERNNRLVDLREVCEDGISFLSTIRSRRWRPKAEAVERYLVIKLVDACWAMNDFDTIRYFITSRYKKAPQSIPIRAFLKYCISLLYSSEYDGILSTVRAVKRAYPQNESQAFVTADVAEAAVLIDTAKLSDARSLLAELDLRAHRLSFYGQCRLLTCHTIVYDKLDNERLTKKHIRMLEEFAEKHGFIHEYLIGAYARFNISFKKSRLRESKTIIKRAVRVAMKHKLYYRVADWHFLASAVYYEEGAYLKSIHHVEQCLQLAERLGLVYKVPEMLTRLSMNYLNAGLYGNSVRYIKRAIRQWNRSWNAAEGAVILLFAFEVHITINSNDMTRYRDMAKQYLDAHSEVNRWGYYWYLSGLYSYQIGAVDRAVKKFRRARIDEEERGAIDDSVRSGMKEAVALVDLARLDEAKALISQLRRISRTLESKNIEAELKVLELSYHYVKRSTHATLYRYIKAVEEVRDQAKEVPVLMMIDKSLFRTKARCGDLEGAKVSFKRYLKRLKSISDNIQDKEDAVTFLAREDDRLALQEYKLICNK